MKLSHALRITPGEVVAFVGGGGKTTTMFQLAHELAPRLRVLITTTTRIFAAQIKRAPAHITFDPATQTVADILPHLEAAIAGHGQVLLIGQADTASGKAFGIPPDIIDELAASGHFDLILNEADGSRMRPFKAPAAHEPVIPASTTLVVPVVGLDALGQPLSEETVHRAELVSQLSGTILGQPITPQTIAAVLSHPAGGLKNVPAQARVIPLLNKLDWVRRGGEEARRRGEGGAAVGVAVLVGVGVSVGKGVSVEVGVRVGVAVGVKVGVEVGVSVEVKVGVAVAVGVSVGVGVAKSKAIELLQPVSWLIISKPSIHFTNLITSDYT